MISITELTNKLPTRKHLTATQERNKTKTITISPEELKDLMTKFQIIRIPSILDCSMVALKKFMQDHNIEAPPKGYWLTGNYNIDHLRKDLQEYPIFIISREKGIGSDAILRRAKQFDLKLKDFGYWGKQPSYKKLANEFSKACSYFNLRELSSELDISSPDLKVICRDLGILL